MTQSALSRTCPVLRMPSASKGSLVSRSPAVSKRRTGIPSRLTVPSSQSRVVPCTSETIARSWRRMALKRLDFPEFVAPAIATLAPSW